MNKRIDAVRLIKDRINIVDILEKDLRLIKSGSNYKALCPFHKEKTPSFVVNVLKQSYACYGCGKNGDIFSYVMEKYKIDILALAETHINTNSTEVHDGYTFIFSTNVTDEQRAKADKEREKMTQIANNSIMLATSNWSCRQLEHQIF